MADRILTEYSASISELKSSPMNAVSSAGGNAIAILNRSKPAFYVVPVDLYEQMMEKLDDLELIKTINERHNESDISVSLDDL